MTLDKKVQNDIINSTYEKFKNVTSITYEYIEDFLKAILNEQPTYDIFTLNIPHLLSSSNPEMDIKFIIQNNIYYKLCTITNDDIEALLFLTEDKTKVATLVLKKLGINDPSKVEDYLIDAFPNFNGKENFNTFITRYIMAKVKGKPFIPYEEPKTIEPVIPDTKKDKKKKKKSKGNYTNLPVRESPKKPLVSIVKEEEIPALPEEPVIKAPQGAIKPPPLEIPLEEPTNKPAESVKPEEPIKPETPWNPILELKSRTGTTLGTGTPDPLINASSTIHLFTLIQDIEDQNYQMYILLRLGFINNSYFTKEEISTILKLSISNIITYERFTWNIIREAINNKLSNYETYLLTKSSINN